MRQDDLDSGAKHVPPKGPESQPGIVAGGWSRRSIPAFLSKARSESARETAIGPDTAEALARMGKTLSAKDSCLSHGHSAHTQDRTANCFISLTRQRPFPVDPIGRTLPSTDGGVRRCVLHAHRRAGYARTKRKARKTAARDTISTILSYRLTFTPGLRLRSIPVVVRRPHATSVTIERKITDFEPPKR
jgi:hypothetical protein